MTSIILLCFLTTSSLAISSSAASAPDLDIALRPSGINKNICVAVLNKFKLSFLSPLFDPGQQLRAQGINPGLVSLKFDMLPSEGYIGSLSVFYDKNLVVKISFAPEKESQRARAITTSHLDVNAIGNLKGRGLGTLAYLSAGFLLYHQHHIDLTSDQLGRPEEMKVSKDAYAVWERFWDLGFATTDGGEPGTPIVWRFEKGIFETDLFEPLLTFLKTHLKDPQD